MKSLVQAALIVFLVYGCIGERGMAHAAQYDDADALTGVTAAKTLFDINLSEPQKLGLYLRVINQTYDDLLRQGRQPEMVVAFRGASVRLISTERWSFSEEDQQQLIQSASLLKELKAKGVRLEACSIATDLFRIDTDTILPEIKVVGNTFVSLTAYQSRGYNLIPIQ